MSRQLPFSDDQLAALFAAMAKVPAPWRGRLMLAVVDHLNGDEDPTDEELERAIAVVLERVGVSTSGHAWPY